MHLLQMSAGQIKVADLIKKHVSFLDALMVFPNDTSECLTIALTLVRNMD